MHNYIERIGDLPHTEPLGLSKFVFLPPKTLLADGLEEVRTLTSKLSILGLNIIKAINCHAGVSHAG